MQLTLEDIRKKVVKEINVEIEGNVIYKGSMTAAVEQAVIGYFTSGDLEGLEQGFVKKAMALSLGVVDVDTAREVLITQPGLDSAFKAFIEANGLEADQEVVMDNLYTHTFKEVGTMVLEGLEGTPTK